jgi:tetratricopeptide (TPR) repeat protein
MFSSVLKSSLLGALMLAAISSAFACTAPKVLEEKIRLHPDGDVYAEAGTWFSEHRQYECALEAFGKGLKLEPGSSKLYYLVGLTLYASGNPDQALQPLAKSIYLMPDVLKAHLLLAMSLDAVKRRQEARQEWTAALRIDHKSIEAYDGLAKSLMADGDTYSAIEALREAPASEMLTLDLALAYGRANMLDKAAEVLTQALKRNPSSLPLISALVTVYVRQVHYEDAVHITERYARLHPGTLEAQRLYLRVLVLEGNATVARPLGKKLLAAHPHDFDFLYLNGILENQDGKYEIARRHLEESAKIDPKYYNVRYNLGLVLLALKDFAGAREQFEKALALGATEPEVRFKYATALRTMGETEKAKEQLKLYQDQIHAQEKRALSNSKAAQADKEVESGETAKAVADYREALDATPDDAHVAYKLAMALDKAGNTAEERNALEQAIKIDSGFALAQNQLGYLDSQQGDPGSAEEHFRAAVKAAPGYTQAWISLAATLGMQAKYSEAQEALASALKLEPDNADALQLRKDLDAAQQPR